MAQVIDRSDRQPNPGLLEYEQKIAARPGIGAGFYSLGARRGEHALSLRYLIRRLLAALPVMLVVALTVFLLLRLAPGDPAAILAGDAATPEQIGKIRQTLGLDQPIAIQFALWFAQLVRGDLGLSLISGLPVTQVIAQRLEPTLWLTVLTMLFSSLVAIPLGVIAAGQHGRLGDRIVSAAAVLGFSVPFFVVGYLLMLLLAIELGWLPVQGYRSPSDGIGVFLQHQILPVMTLSTPLIALIARITRASMLDVLGQDYVRTARAKGLSDGAVLYRHALRGASLPILTVIGNGFAILIGGAIVTESIFNLPGLGRLTVDAVLARDYPVIQGIILLSSALYVLLNLAIDLVYAALDPRLRYE
jgi:peptide/nickel transport system permease protein